MIPKPPERVATICKEEDLRTICSQFGERAWITVDTEFLRERTYYPRLCLVQLSDGDRVALIDVLAIADLSALTTLLTAPGLLKVFHAVGQDLEVLYQSLGRLPSPVFDTQPAAALLGYDDQMGYARLIETVLGVSLPKAHTRTDWSRRPLPDGALDYAADDVHYLAAVYPVLRERLEARGRLGWLLEDFRHLAEPDRLHADPARAWRRVKGWQHLTAGSQQVLAELADWRERQAMQNDKPRRWILSDDALVETARQQPQTPDELAAMAVLPRKTVARHAQSLIQCVAAGRARDAVALADTHVPGPDEKRRIKAGMKQLAEQAEAHGIARAALASRSEIERLVYGERDTPLTQGWRAEVAGYAVLRAIGDAGAGGAPE